MIEAVFLDRDGVITEDGDYLNAPEDVRLIPGAVAAIGSLNDKNYLLIVITNQAAIAKGMTTQEAVEETHREIQRRLQRAGAHIDAFYYCPHHPEGRVKKHVRQCDCRKPEVGMIQEAIKDHHIAMEGSFLVGDKTSDVLAGKRMGLTTILVRTGYGGSDALYDVVPDFVADNLTAAAALIPHARV